MRSVMQLPFNLTRQTVLPDPLDIAHGWAGLPCAHATPSARATTSGTRGSLVMR
jgi:hypothetical protein